MAQLPRSHHKHANMFACALQARILSQLKSFTTPRVKLGVGHRLCCNAVRKSKVKRYHEDEHAKKQARIGAALYGKSLVQAAGEAWLQGCLGGRALHVQTLLIMQVVGFRVHTLQGMAHNKDKNACLNMLFDEYEQLLEPQKNPARKIVHEARCVNP